jgi:transcriptional antiterminator RfaH
MALSWYTIRSKPNKEDFLSRQLKAHELEVFFPVLRVKPVNPRSRKIRPYFPNYLFLRVDLDVINISDLQWMPGASNLVSFDGVPASVPDSLIDAIRKKVNHHNEVMENQTKNFVVGDEVVIQGGPFAGYEAVFDANISGEDRVRVLLNLLQGRKMPIEIEGRQIRRANQR